MIHSREQLSSTMPRPFLWALFLASLLLLMGSGGAEAGCTVKCRCASWMRNNEVNNIQGWRVTPSECRSFVRKYMTNGQYMVDTVASVNASGEYLNLFAPADDKHDAVVFDIDETSLSNVPYYRRHNYGGEPFNATAFDNWVLQGVAPPLLPTLSLYKHLRTGNWALIFITGRSENQRDLTTKNLQAAGYHDWAELILRLPSEEGMLGATYKEAHRVELETKGYRIRSCIGDQWSDCAGAATGNRTFKLPNPMYNIL